ncbi:AmmeMemoRadiSam system radical SAM enzyme [Clostridia bacterium]|nr:AmmeMemoRadiSam system radical SAM enzyme [Clostridia bacterium]
MIYVKEARYYQKLKDNSTHCLLCPHQCHIKVGEMGLCNTRENKEGRLLALNYEEVASLALDPIEKKPLRRFHPGSTILSAGTYGCNMFCPYCQNYELSRAKPGKLRTNHISASKLVNIARQEKSKGNIGLAFTYNEPTVWYEYVLEAAKLAKENNLLVVLVTNGCIEEEPLRELLPYVDAMNIDLKSINPTTYRKTLKGDICATKRTIELAVQSTHVEITTLMVPGLNDSEGEFDETLSYLAGISRNLPLHISRFFPRYKMNHIPATDTDAIYAAMRRAKKKLKYVYSGNLK